MLIDTVISKKKHKYNKYSVKYNTKSSSIIQQVNIIGVSTRN